MTSPARLMAAGIQGGAALQLGQSSVSTLTALGTTKATALVLASSINVFSTVATATGLGAILPRCEAMPPQVVFNGGAKTLAIYARGASGTIAAETVNALSTGGAYSIAAGQSAVFWPAQSKPGWVAMTSA